MEKRRLSTKRTQQGDVVERLGKANLCTTAGADVRPPKVSQYEVTFSQRKETK